MAELPELISKQNRKYYSTDKNDLRKPAKIMKTSDITIFLRQDRNV